MLVITTKSSRFSLETCDWNGSDRVSLELTVNGWNEILDSFAIEMYSFLLFALAIVYHRLARQLLLKTHKHDVTIEDIRIKF